jgi:hypothetical protein
MAPFFFRGKDNEIIRGWVGVVENARKKQKESGGVNP